MMSQATFWLRANAARAIAGLEEEVIYGSDGEGGKHDIGRLKKIRLTGKIPALEGLARHLGMFQALGIAEVDAQVDGPCLGRHHDGGMPTIAKDPVMRVASARVRPRSVIIICRRYDVTLRTKKSSPRTRSLLPREVYD